MLGKHSGRHAFVDRLKALGVELGQVDMNKAFERFKALADSQEEHLRRGSARRWSREEATRVRERYELVYLNVTSSSMAVPHATREAPRRRRGARRPRDRRRHGRRLLQGDQEASRACEPQLDRYGVKRDHRRHRRAGRGRRASVRENGVAVSGQGAHTDIIMASALAYVNALNKLEYRTHRQRHRSVEP